MRKGKFVLAAFLLVVFFMVLLQACGAGVEKITDRQASSRIMLTENELPRGSKLAKKPIVGPECSPVYFFRGFAEATSSSPGYYLPDTKFLQQVGVFTAPSEANRALRLVLSDRAQKCVQRKMRRTSLQVAGNKGTIWSRVISRHLSDVETRTIQIRLTNPFGWLEVDQTFLLDGPALTSLTYISENRQLKHSTWARIAKAAARELNETSHSLEA